MNTICIDEVDSTNQVREMIDKLSILWKDRAAINNSRTDFLGIQFNPYKHDFIEKLLPFANHEAWINNSEGMKNKCLSYAWVLYNLKTIYIECDIVTPVCESFIKNPIQSKNSHLIQSAMADALLDEALHTHMSINACQYIYFNRNIEPIHFTDFNLIKWKYNILSSCNSHWERRLAEFGIACASETLITDYLKVMSEDNNIQPICQQVTKTHANDEFAHSSVFSYVAIDVVHTLSPKERIFLQNLISETVHMFANNELEAWEYVFKKINLPNWRDIIHDSKQASEINIYKNSVDNLINRIGLGV